MLEQQRIAGEIRLWMFEPVGLRLGAKCFYHPDFMVVMAHGEIEMHKVKGHWRDDARVKIKAAADKFPFRFVAVQRVNLIDCLPPRRAPGRAM